MLYVFICSRFVLGGENVDAMLLKDVQKESENHGDIAILPDVTDSFYSLTSRTLKSFKYAENHLHKFLYVMKCDDDSMVDVRRVASELQLRKRKNRLYWGYMDGSSAPQNWFSRYYEKNWFICKKYITYAYGDGYILSRDLVELLAQNEQFLNTAYNNEDAAVGAWLAPYNFEYKHDSRFGAHSRGCKDPFLLLHKVSISDMLYYHNSYSEVNRYCSQRTYWHSGYGYLYNWNVTPSYCCPRNSEVP